jgi:hypothetical protein
MTDNRRQKTDDRKQKTEDRRQRTEGRGQKTEDRNQKPKDLDYGMVRFRILDCGMRIEKVRIIERGTKVSPAA